MHEFRTPRRDPRAPVHPTPGNTSAGEPGAGSDPHADPDPQWVLPDDDVGRCYEPGEYCPVADDGMSGVAGDGEAITCEDNNGWRWEPTTTTTAPPPAPGACYPLTNSGGCYEPGEYCRDADHGASGVAGDGEAITCEYNNGWRWEPT